MDKEPDDMSKDELWEALNGATGFKRGDILLNLSQHLLHEDSYQPALTCAQEAVDAFDTAGFPRERAYSLRQIAHVLQHEGRMNEAIEGFREVLPLLEAHGSDRDIAMAHESIANGLRNMDNYEEAAYHYDLAEDFFMRSANCFESAILAGRNFAGCLTNVGGRDDEVLSTLERILDYAKGGLAVTKINEMRCQLVYALARVDRFEDALVEAKNLLAVAKACSCNSCVPDALIDLAYIYDISGDTESARKYYQQAFDIAFEKSMVSPQAHALIFFAEQAVENDLAAARDFVLRAEAIYDSTGSLHGVANAKNVYAQIAVAEGKLDQAIAFLKEEVALCEQMNDKQHLAETRQELAKVYLLKGSSRNALQELSANGWVDRTGPIHSKGIGEHKALYAKALLADGQVDAAINRVTELLAELDPETWLDVHGMAHEVRAYALRHRDPIASERAAARALACYTVSGDDTSTRQLSQEFFIQPYLTLAKIDVDNQLRAEAQEAELRVKSEMENVHFLDVVAKSALPDPIEQEAEAAQVHQIRSDENDEGIA